MPGERNRRLQAANACWLAVTVCALLTAPHAVAAGRALHGQQSPTPEAAHVAAALQKLSSLLNTLAGLPFPVSIVAWFNLLVVVFPGLARYQPIVNKLAAPPAPPLVSTVDPSAHFYIPLNGTKG